MEVQKIKNGKALKETLKKHKGDRKKMIPFAQEMINSLMEKISDDAPLYRKVDPSLIGFTSYYTPQARDQKGMKLTSLGGTTLLGEGDAFEDREGILIERDLKKDPGKLSKEALKAIPTWLFEHNTLGNGEKGKGALFHEKYEPQRQMIKKQISSHLAGQLSIDPTKITDEMLRQMLLEQEVAIGDAKVQLAVHPIVYLMGECANESYGFRIEGIKVTHANTDEVIPQANGNKTYTFKTNLFNAKSVGSMKSSKGTRNLGGAVIDSDHGRGNGQ